MDKQADHVSTTIESNPGDQGPLQLPLNKSPLTRGLCIASLILSWILGIGLIVLGVHVAKQHTTICQVLRPYGGGLECSYFSSEGYYARLPGSATFYKVLPLLLNLLVTGLVDGTGFIHTLSLKWAMLQENRLAFNSNLRLFTSSRNSVPNSWYSNTLVILATIFAYAAPSTILNGPTTYKIDEYQIDGHAMTGYWFVAAIPVLFLGASFVVLAGISTAALAGTSIPTWSSHPLDTVYACLQNGSIQRRPGRCMLSIHEAAEPAHPAKPSSKQKPAWRANKEIKRVVIYFWCLVVLSVLGTFFAMIVLPAIWAQYDRPVDVPGLLVYGNTSGETGPPTHDAGYWSFVPTDGPTWTLTFYIQNRSILVTYTLHFVLYAAIQASMTLSLHCAELISNFSRDETIWRSATSLAGCRVRDYNSVLAACKSWQAISLFIGKSVMHWLFGLAVRGEEGLVMYGPQLVYLSAATVVLAIAVTAISFRGARGPQPAAYGHFQTLADLVDEFAETVFWGDKSDGMVVHAGTAGTRLPEVEMEGLYS